MSKILELYGGEHVGRDVVRLVAGTDHGLLLLNDASSRLLLVLLNIEAF